jgi:signal transduction histidine kinase
MTDATTSFPDPMKLDHTADLQTVLAAWHGATLRLEQTHSALRAEVRRLTDELEIKNIELARKNRLADLGQMASHIAHEVRNNLVPVSLYTSLLRRRLSTDPGSADILDKVESGLTALDVTVNDLLHFTSDREPQLGWVDLGRLVDEVLGSLAPQLAAQQIRPEIDAPKGVGVSADHGMLRRAVLNLVLNALDAMPDGGDLVVTVWHNAGSVELEIADSGHGLSDEARARAFEPFYTTKSHGTGLGLAIVYRIVEAHGGQILAHNCPEGGAAFTLRLPRRAMERAA